MGLNATELPKIMTTVSNIINIRQFHACYNLRWFYDEHKYCMYYLTPVMTHLRSENRPKKNHISWRHESDNTIRCKYATEFII